MDADWDTNWIFIEATDIVVDQSKALHCERAGSKEHGADGGEEKKKREKGDGDKTGNQNVAWL